MHNESGPQFELPSQPQTPEQAAQQPEQEAEQQRPAKQEAGVGKKAPRPGSTAVTDDTAVIADIPAEPAAPAVPISSATADLPASDIDLIEKQWINRTKMVIAKTHDDPHLQKSEMSKVKADYIQKRFKKTIKTDEATA